MKSRLQNNNIEMHSTYNKEKFVVAERFTRTLKNNIYMQVTLISKNVYIYVVVSDVSDVSDLNSGEIAGTFYGKELRKVNQTEFRVEKLI